MSASNAAATQFTIRPRQTTEPKASTAPKARASLGVILPARDRPRRGARHRRVDIGVVPHIQRTGGAGAGGNADQRRDRQNRDASSPGAATMPDQRGEHHEEHHPRLHQRDIVGDVAAAIGQYRGRDGLCDVGHALYSLDVRCRCRTRRYVACNPSSFDARQRLIGVERRRRRQRPFERGGAWPQGFAASRAPCAQRRGDAEQEHQEAGEGDIGADRGRPSSSRRTHPDSRHSGAACRQGPGNAAGRRSRLAPMNISQKCSLPMRSRCTCSRSSSGTSSTRRRRSRTRRRATARSGSAPPRNRCRGTTGRRRHWPAPRR